MNAIIRHLSIETNCEYFLAAEFEKYVHIYLKGESKRIKTMETNLDFGGNRLQIIPKYNLIIAGAYHKYGIEAYSILTNKLIWKRKDLKKVQNIRLHPKKEIISCFFEDSAGQLINYCTGETINKYRGIKNIFFDDNELYLLEESRLYVVKKNNKIIFKINPESFAILDASFSDKYLAVSESGKDVRIFSLESGIEIGRYKPIEGYHILKLIYSDRNDIFVGLLWGYQSKGDYYIVHFSEKGEEIRKIKTLHGYASSFLKDRNSFINAIGQEIDYSSGKIIFRYKFPKSLSMGH